MNVGNIAMVMLLTEKSFEIFPKHNGYFFISESCFKLIYYCGIKK